MAFHNARDVWGREDRGFYSVFMLFSDIHAERTGLADSLLDSRRLLAPTDAIKY